MNDEAVKSAAEQRTGSSRAGDGALRTLGELEQHFERIKKLHAETAQRESELERLSSQVEERTREIEARAAALDAKVQEIDAGRAALERARQEVAASRQEVESLRARLEGEQREIAGARAALAELQKKIDGARAQLDAREKAAAGAESKVAEGKAALAEEQRRLEGARASLESDRMVVEKLLSESGARDEALGERERSLAELERALVERERQVGEGEGRVAQREQELEAARNDAESLRAEAVKERSRLEADQREVAASQQRLASMMKAVQARAAELEARERALMERERGVQKGAAKGKEAERAADAQVRALEAALAERAALIASRDAEIADLRTQSERLAGEVREAQAGAEEARRQASEGIAAAKAAAEAQIAQHAAAKAAPVGPSPEAERELEKSRRAIELLAEKLRAAQREIEQLRAKAAETGSRAAQGRPSSDGRIKTDPHNVLRRRRLQKYKSLLQTQARKIMSAQAALTKRQAEAEQVLAHRAKLAAAAEVVRQREIRLNSQRSKSAGATVMAAFALSAAALAAMSWFTASKVAPATYVTSATIEAEVRGRANKTSDDLEGWQVYHTELVEDPQLMGQAAERMARRGIASLGTPAALQAHLKDHLLVETPKNGALVLQLRGSDAQQTATVLDTFVTAVAASANMTRTQRPDGMVTEITRAVEVPKEPVTHERLTYAGAIFGGSMLLAMMLGAFGWQRTARSRGAVDADEALGKFLDEGSWPQGAGHGG